MKKLTHTVAPPQHPSSLLVAMQTPPTTTAVAAAVAAERLPPRYGDRYVVRLSGTLAALCGQEGEEVLYYEDELLGVLRAKTLEGLDLATATGRLTGLAAAAAVAGASMLAALLRPGTSGDGSDSRGAVHDDAVLGRLREAGLITYPSPLLGRVVQQV